MPLQNVLARMAKVRDIFRECPSCGKRFHVRLVDKTLVKGDLRVVTVDSDHAMSPGMGGFGALAAAGPLVVGEDIPLTVDARDFSYRYRCKHCGRTWTEEHEEDTRA